VVQSSGHTSRPNSMLIDDPKLALTGRTFRGPATDNTGDLNDSKTDEGSVKWAVMHVIDQYQMFFVMTGKGWTHPIILGIAMTMRAAKQWVYTLMIYRPYSFRTVSACWRHMKPYKSLIHHGDSFFWMPFCVLKSVSQQSIRTVKIPVFGFRLQQFRYQTCKVSFWWVPGELRLKRASQHGPSKAGPP